MVNPYQDGVRWLGEEPQRREPYGISMKGVGFVPEDRRIFFACVWRKTLRLARSIWTGLAPGRSVAYYGLFSKRVPLKVHKGNELRGGEQQMPAIARVPMGAPKRVVGDASSEGLAPAIGRGVGEMIGALRDEGLAVPLVEQNARFFCRLSELRLHHRR